MSFLDGLLSPALTVATQAYGAKQGAEAAGKQQETGNAIALLRVKRQQEQDARALALQQKQLQNYDSEIAARDRPRYDPMRGAMIDPVKGTAAPVAGLPDRAAPEHPASTIPGTPEWRQAQIDRAQIAAKYGYHPEQVVIQTGVDADGQQHIYRVPKTSGAAQEVEGITPSPKTLSGRSAATITKAVAKNQQQLSVIDDALKELEAYPDAVGLSRGLPILGDRLDQRVDPKGVAARAAIANIGSLQIHDRTGAAMTIHEEPRLAPFVPNVGDTPEAIRTKLEKLRAAIHVETEGLQGGIPAASGAGQAHLTPAEPAPAAPTAPQAPLAPLSPQDRLRAKADPGFAAWLRSRGYPL